jgi:hypothetical protein
MRGCGGRDEYGPYAGSLYWMSERIWSPSAFFPYKIPAKDPSGRSLLESQRDLILFKPLVHLDEMFTQGHERNSWQPSVLVFHQCPDNLRIE